jgi:hypothetical protein
MLLIICHVWGEEYSIIFQVKNNKLKMGLFTFIHIPVTEQRIFGGWQRLSFALPIAFGHFFSWEFPAASPFLKMSDSKKRHFSIDPAAS